MTAQISDQIIYQKGIFSLGGVSGEGLFEPQAHGLLPKSRCTACWRGYYCWYIVQDDQLLLLNLNISLAGDAHLFAKHGKGVALFGKLPKMTEDHFTDFTYEQLLAPVEYTGGLLACRDFIEEMYVHMGFHPAWKYREVHELIFNKGQLVTASDRSAEMAKLRDSLADTSDQPDTMRKQDVIQWVDRCFSLKYKW